MKLLLVTNDSANSVSIAHKSVPILELGDVNLAPRREDHAFLDYSELFQQSNAFECEYGWFDESTGEQRLENATAFRSDVRSVVARLELLGYSLAKARQFYEIERQRDIERGYRSIMTSNPAFDALAYAFRMADMSGIEKTENVFPASEGPWASVGSHLLSQLDDEFRKLIDQEMMGLLGDSVDETERLLRWVVTKVWWLDSFTLLQLLALNPDNGSQPVIWHPTNELQTYDVLDDRNSSDESQVGAKRRNRFLVVTEGSSDAAIIRKALSLLRPAIADFFDFVDMHKNYPFTGIGNLHNFYQGLLKIGILNDVLFVYDNDAEGARKLASA